MDIPQLWKLYSSSEERVPEFDTALAGLAKELRVSPEKAFGVFIQIIGTPEMSSVVRASVSFPLIKMAADGKTIEEVKDRALKLLSDIEKADISPTSPDSDAAKKTISAAEAEIKAMLESGDVVDKQGLHSAFTDHKAVFTRSKVLERLEKPSGLLNLSSKTLDEIGGAYAAGDWDKISTKTTTERMLDSAAAGDKHALEDFAKMSQTTKGQSLLATVDPVKYDRRLADIAKKIEQANMPKINVTDLLNSHERNARYLAEAAARRADPKRLLNIIRDVFGTGVPTRERAAAMGRALGYVKDLAVSAGKLAVGKPKLSLALILAAGGAAIFAKTTDFLGGGDKAKPGSDSASTDSKSSEKDSSASPASMDSASVSSGAALQGDIADRVAARLIQVYSGGKR
jgi:hypothetical protein